MFQKMITHFCTPLKKGEIVICLIILHVENQKLFLLRLKNVLLIIVFYDQVCLYYQRHHDF